MNLILIRHGETDANGLYGTPEQLLIGALDNELTQLNEKGRQQARHCQRLLEKIPVDRIFCSDLGRTKETAAILFEGRTIQYDARLRERSLGCLEGRKLSDVMTDATLSQVLVDPDNDSFEQCMIKKAPDGENFLEVQARCRDFLSQFDSTQTETVAIVSHFHFLRVMIAELEGRPNDPSLFQTNIPNAVPLFYCYNGTIFEAKPVFKP